jgi:hypothetical protein
VDGQEGYDSVHKLAQALVDIRHLQALSNDEVD